MPRQLDPESETVRTQIVSSQAFLDRVDDWRRAQPILPSKSAAIRALVEIALDGTAGGGTFSDGTGVFVNPAAVIVIPGAGR